VVRFADRILVIDENIAERRGVLTAQAKATANRTLPVIDRLLAATPLTLVTCNLDEITGTGVPVFNPWA
jgi:predicted nucleic acid-binding protein